MGGLALARAQENGSSVSCSDEPEERVDEINPDSTLHANDARLFGRVFGVDVNLAENAKECEPKDAMPCMSMVLVEKTCRQQAYQRIQSQANAQYDLKNGIP